MGAFDEDDDYVKPVAGTKHEASTASHFSVQQQRASEAPRVPIQTPKANPLKFGIPAGSLKATAIGFFVGMVIGGIPRLLHEHDVWVFAPDCLSMGVFVASLFGAYVSFRRKRMEYVFIFLAIGIFVAQLLFSVRGQIFLITYLKELLRIR